jgi:hypothetical protein
MRETLNEERTNESPRMDESLRQRLEGLMPEILRRTFAAGWGAVFNTEESVRKIASEFSLPKEAVRYVIQHAQLTKDELFRAVSVELRSFLDNLNLAEELQRLLTNLSLEIRTEVRFIPNDAKLVKPDIKNTISIKHRKDKEDKTANKDSDISEGDKQEEKTEEISGETK